jgi:hypothetical protein
MRDSAGATKADVRAQMRPSAMRGLGERVDEMRHGQRNRRQGNATPWLTSASMEMPDESDLRCAGAEAMPAGRRLAT